MRGYRKRWAIGSAALVAVALACVITFRPHRASPEPSTYVNPALCANCHPAIAKAYGQTGMARSFSRPRPEAMMEDFQKNHDLHHRASDRDYSMISRDGKWLERRHQIGFDGRETNVVEAEIDYVIGSGAHARTYLHRTSEGKLVELPVTWYSENGGSWAMSPGYDRANHSDFRRAISFECMSCHNGYPSVPQTNGSNTIFAGAELPEGIDCQRCHGPGSAHVNAAQSGEREQEIRAAIVNPARLTRDRQLDVCLQCHLQSTALHAPDSIRRYERAPFGFRPGESLSSYTVYFDFPGQETFEIDHAAYRLAKSKCFERSQMTCTTCHDPHQASEKKHFGDVCANCHQAAHPATIAIQGKSCLDCHMPKRRADDVVHAVMTDHFIQRRLPSSPLLAERKETHTDAGEIALYKPSSESSDELYLGVAQARQVTGSRKGIATLEASIERDHPTRPEFYFELGTAYVKFGEVEKGVHWLEEALRIRPDFAPALKELGAALSDSGQLARAAEVLEKATAPPARDAQALTDLAGVYIQQRKLEQAEQALQKAVAIDPDLPDAFNLQGLARMQRRDAGAAEASFREAIRLQPDLSPAQVNLGNLLASTGDFRQAIFHLKNAVASDPSSVDAHYNLGQAYAASGSLANAQSELEAAVRLKPDFAKAHNDLGRLLAMQRQINDAIAQFRKAIELDANLREAHENLGELLATTNRFAEAEQQFRAAIKLDPDDYPAHFALARILAARRSTEAAEHFEKASQSPDPALRSAVARFR